MTRVLLKAETLKSCNLVLVLFNFAMQPQNHLTGSPLMSILFEFSFLPTVLDCKFTSSINVFYKNYFLKVFSVVENLILLYQLASRIKQSIRAVHH